MLELAGLVFTLMVIIYAVSKGMLGDLVRPYVDRIMSRGGVVPVPAPRPAARPPASAPAHDH